MNRSHFKSFFENYFNYPYEKLKFQNADIIKKELAYFYKCPLSQVDCFFLFTKIIKGHEVELYGFYRINKSDFYIPFFIHCNDYLVTAHVNLLFNYSINNSVFDCDHVPLKKEKTSEFYQQCLKAICPEIKELIFNSDLNTLVSTVLKSIISFSFDLYSYTLEIFNKGKNFNESFYLNRKSKNDYIRNSFEEQNCYRYELNYYVNNIKEALSLDTDNPLNFNKYKMLEQSFSGMTDFGDFYYNTIDELDSLVKGYRQLEKMYVI